MPDGLFRPRGNRVRHDELTAANQDYDDARADDEQRGRLKPNSYLGRKLSQAVDTVDPEQPALNVDPAKPTAVPPDQHDELMKRVG